MIDNLPFLEILIGLVAVAVIGGLWVWVKLAEHKALTGKFFPRCPAQK